MAALELSQANVKAAEESINAAQATIVANDANLHRLENLKSFDRIVAPFDGVITYRSQQLDVGTLVTAGNTSSSREMIRVAQIDKLRVYIPIPQTYAEMIHAGVPVDLVVDELPGQVFHTKVDAVTHSVESDSRTMLAMLIVNNAKETLLPGMYAKARFMLPHALNILMLPADALILPKEGPEVAIVGDDHKVHFRKVTIGRDYGAEVEIESGLDRWRDGGAESHGCGSRRRDGRAERAEVATERSSERAQVDAHARARFFFPFDAGFTASSSAPTGARSIRK